MTTPRCMSCDLQPGDLVRHKDGTEGTIQFVHGRGDMPMSIMGPFEDDDAIIWLGPGMQRISNMHADWSVVR